jgi:Holliday junction DNA helicase RuvB
MTNVGKGSPDPLRPATLDDVIGQHEVVEALRVALNGARARGELPGHILLGGPAGTGKTTLSLIIANSLNAAAPLPNPYAGPYGLAGVLGDGEAPQPQRSRMVSLIGPELRSIESLRAPLREAGPRDVFFLDEIHRMYRAVQEWVYPVMEDGRMLDGGQMVPVPPVLFIGATTEPERLQTPMLDRFALVLMLRPYTDDELARIATRAAGKLGCTLTEDAAMAVAQAADGIPRVAIRLVRTARDYAYAHSQGVGTVRQGRVNVVGYGVIDLAGSTVHAGPVEVNHAAVQAALSSPAYAWRTEGRMAG